MYTSVEIPSLLQKDLCGCRENSKSIEQSHQEEFKEMSQKTKPKMKLSALWKRMFIQDGLLAGPHVEDVSQISAQFNSLKGPITQSAAQ